LRAAEANFLFLFFFTFLPKKVEKRRMATGLTDTTGYYELLGIEKGPQTSQDDIKKAWRKAALRLHPDRNPDGEYLCMLCGRRELRV